MAIFLLWFLFQTLDVPHQIGVVGDTQSNYWVARKVVQDMKARDLSLAVHLGDYAGCQSLRKWRRVRSLLMDFPRWKWTIGNHEIMRCGGRTSPKRKRRWVRFWQPQINSTVQAYLLGGWMLVHLDSSWIRTPRKHVIWLKELLSKWDKFLIFTHRSPPAPGKLRAHMDPQPFSRQNRKLWKVLITNKHKIKALFHGHHHIHIDYNINGLRVINTGGGGGLLAKGGFFHYLVVSLNPFKIEVVRIVK